MTDATMYECETCGDVFWQALPNCANKACGENSVRAVPAASLRLTYKRPDGKADIVQIVRPLGAGGHASVFEATGEARAVVKLPRRDLFRGHPDRVAATKAELAREIQMLLRVARTKSEDRFHLAEFLGAGLLSDGVPYVVMRYVDGRNLAEVIDEAYEDLRSYPSMSMVVGALLGAARGLRLLHAGGILHRDVKPNNIVVPLGRPEFSVLVDLGTAKPESGEADLRASMEIGPTMNRLYSAPEYVQTGRASFATDLYAFGITAFEALTGTLPHELELASQLKATRLSVSDLQQPANQLRLASLRAQSLPKFPDGVLARLPPALVELVRSLLEPEPTKRLSSADTLVRALEGVACSVEGSGLLFRATTQTEPTPLPGSEPPILDPSSKPHLRASARETTQHRRPNRFAWAAAAAVGISLGAGGVAWMSHRTAEEDTIPTAAIPSAAVPSGAIPSGAAPSTPAPASTRPAEAPTAVALAVTAPPRPIVPQPAEPRREPLVTWEHVPREEPAALPALVSLTIVSEPSEATVTLGDVVGKAPVQVQGLKPGDEVQVIVRWADGHAISKLIEVPESDEIRTYSRAVTPAEAASSAPSRPQKQKRIDSAPSPPPLGTIVRTNY